MNERVPATRAVTASPATTRPRRRSFVGHYLTPKRGIPRRTVAILGIVSFVVIVAGWTLLAILTYNPDVSPEVQLVPRPDVVVVTWVDMVQHLGFMADVGCGGAAGTSPRPAGRSLRTLGHFRAHGTRVVVDE